jgi:hypothetical protein
MYLLSGIKVDFELTARDILLGLGRTAVDVTLLRG